jgi:hypothetical protein
MVAREMSETSYRRRLIQQCLLESRVSSRLHMRPCLLLVPQRLRASLSSRLSRRLVRGGWRLAEWAVERAAAG